MVDRVSKTRFVEEFVSGFPSSCTEQENSCASFFRNIKLSADVEMKLKRNSFETVLKLFLFRFHFGVFHSQNLNLHRTNFADVFTGVWLRQSAGSIFCLSTSDSSDTCDRLQEVAAPATIDDIKTTNSLTISTFCATADTLWCVMEDGRVFRRSGIGPRRPTGLDWCPVGTPDLGQLSCFFQVFRGFPVTWAGPVA